MKKIKVIVEFPRGRFIESAVTQRRSGGTNWKDKVWVQNIGKRLMKACIEGEKDLCLLDFDRCMQCMKKTLSGNSIKDLVAASVDIEEFVEKMKAGDAREAVHN